jgi:outer membrane autotransporter protein
MNTLSAVNNSVNVTSERMAMLRNYNGVGDNEGVSAGHYSAPKTIWGQIFGSRTKQEKVKSDEGYKSYSNGFAFGGDGELFTGETIGLSFSYLNSNIKSVSGGSKRTDVDTYQINFYGSKDFNQYFLDTSIGFALNKYSTSKSIIGVNSSSNANFYGQTYIAKIEGGTNKKLGDGGFDITPKLTLTLARSYIDDYTEEGSGTAGLNVSNSHSNFAEGKMGFDLGYNARIKDKKVRPEINLAYGYDFAGSKPTTTSGFVGQSSSSFSSKAAHNDQSSIIIGTSLNVNKTNQLSFKLDYQYEYRDTRDSHTGMFDVKYEF